MSARPPRDDLCVGLFDPELKLCAEKVLGSHAAVTIRHRTTKAVESHHGRSYRRAHELCCRGSDICPISVTRRLDGVVDRQRVVSEMLLERVVDVKTVEGSAVEVDDVGVREACT